MPQKENKQTASSPVEVFTFLRRLQPGVLVYGAAGGAWVTGGDVRVEGGPHYDFVASVAVNEPGDEEPPRAEVRRLVIECRPGGPRIGARLIQDSGVGAVCTVAVRRRSIPVDSDGAPVLDDAGPWEGQGVDAGAVRSVMHKDRRGRPRVEADDLKKGAKAYEAAQREGRSTTKAVADALDVKEGAARKRIMMARDRGFLPPPPPSKRHQRNRKGN